MRPAGGGGTATTETLAYYYVELRTPVDFDGTLGNRSALTPSLLIHVADDVHTRSQKGLHTFLLDMPPTTTGSRAFNDAALPEGATFTDPAGGVSITASAAQATVTVDIEVGTGAPTCLDGTTFTAPGPGPEACGAATGPTGGASGTGSGGNTGNTGSGGTSSPKGSGGIEPSGSGGSAPMGAGATDSVVQSGCQCSSTGSGELPWASGLTFGVVAVLGSRRRRSRR